MFDVLWFVLAGFVLGFAISLLWEWVYFRKHRLNWQNTQIAQLEEEVQFLRSQLDQRAGSFLPAKEESAPVRKKPSARSDDFHSDAARMSSERVDNERLDDKQAGDNSAHHDDQSHQATTQHRTAQSEQATDSARQQIRIMPSKSPATAAPASTTPSSTTPSSTTPAATDQIGDYPSQVQREQSAREQSAVERSSESDSSEPKTSGEIGGFSINSFAEKAQNLATNPFNNPPENSHGNPPQSPPETGRVSISPTKSNIVDPVVQPPQTLPSSISPAPQAPASQTPASQTPAQPYSNPDQSFVEEVGSAGADLVDSRLGEVDQDAAEPSYGQDASRELGSQVNSGAFPQERNFHQKESADPSLAIDASREFDEMQGSADPPVEDEFAQASQDAMTNFDTIYGQKGAAPQHEEMRESQRESESEPNALLSSSELGYEADINFSGEEQMSREDTEIENPPEADQPENERRFDSTLAIAPEIVNGSTLLRPQPQKIHKQGGVDGNALLNRGIQRATVDYPDDLTQVTGIDCALQERLYANGIYTWDQVSKSKPEMLEAATQSLMNAANADFSGWIEQARGLAHMHQRIGAIYSGPMPDDLSEITGLTRAHMFYLYQNGIASYTQLARARKSTLVRIFADVSETNKIDFSTWAKEARRLVRPV